jgi:integrase/recombinase XerD
MSKKVLKNTFKIEFLGNGSNDKIYAEKIPMNPINKWNDIYRSERLGSGINHSTIQNESSILAVFLSFCDEELHKEPNTLTSADLKKFFYYLRYVRKPNNSKIKNKLQNERISEKAFKIYYTLVKKFYATLNLENFKQFEKECQTPIFRKTRPNPHDAITSEEFNKIINEIENSDSSTKIRNILAFRLLWDTGARISEIIKLRYKDCDFEKGRFNISNTNREIRTVVCSKETVKLFNQHLSKINDFSNPDDPIFQVSGGEKSRQISSNYLIKAMTKTVQKLKEKGIIENNRDLVLYSLRPGRAVEVFDGGLSIAHIQQLLGHHDIRTTMKYNPVIERCPDLDNLQNNL